MIRKFKKSKKINNKSSKRRSNSLDYGTLESRQLLAVITSFDANTGNLDIDLTGPKDTAVVSTAPNGELAVNAVNRFDMSAVTSITVMGDASMARQRVILLGDFSETSNSVLSSIDIGQVNEVVVKGNYYLRGDLGVRTVGLKGGFRDSLTGQLTVDGDVDVNTRQNPFTMNNGTHDFRGAVSIITEGAGYNAILTDINDVSLDQVVVSGDLTVNVGGDISDQEGSSIQVDQTATFKGQDAVLGDNTSDVVNLTRVNFDVTGNFELYEDSSINLHGESESDTLTLQTPGGIYDGFLTSVSVTGLADLNADTGIRLGDHFGDLINFGELTFNSVEHVDIWEDQRNASGWFECGTQHRHYSQR